MPFLTEEIWQHIIERTPAEALIVAKYPEQKSYNETLLIDFERAQEVISGIRTIRKDKNISFKETIDLKIINAEHFSTNFDAVIYKLGNIATLEYINEKINGALTFRVKSNEYFIPISGTVNIEEERKKLSDELVYTQGFLKSVQIKLSNEKFVANAKPEIIENERKKEADALQKITTLEEALKGL
jgi:valyl-tRNA synthetase